MRRQLWAAFAVAVAVLAVAASVPGVASASPAASAAPTWFSYSGFDLDANSTYTLAQVQQMQAAADAAASAETNQVESTIRTKPNSTPDGPSGSASPKQTLSPAVDTPDGYKIYKGRKINSYSYESAWVTLGEGVCDPSCHTVDVWKTQLYEWLQGDFSTQWKLTARLQHVSGPGDDNFFYYEYYCGINVSGGNDHQCATSHHASAHVSDSFYTEQTTLTKYFEDNSYANVEFPMLAIGVDFTHTGIVVNRHRGWDVCAGPPYPNTLCTNTDNG